MKALTKSHHTIYFHDWLEICELHLKDPEETKDWLWNFDFNNGIISDANTTDAFRKYHIRVQEQEQRSGLKWRLLCVDVFLDDYLQHKSRRKTVTGVYMRITNKVRFSIFASH